MAGIMMCRVLLLACFFCTLWCGAVMATAPATPNEKVQSVAGVVKNSQEATQKILAYLTTAENCAKKQEEIEKEGGEGTDLTSYYEKTTTNAEELSAAVTNAVQAAEGVATAVKAVEQQLTEEEVKTLMTDAAQKAESVLTAVNNANKEAQVIHETVERIGSPRPDDEPIKDLMKKILPVLEKTKEAANLAYQFFQEAVKKTAGTEGALQETPKDIINPPAETSQGAAGNGSGKGETKHSDRPQDTDMNSLPKPLSSSTDVGPEVSTLSTDTKDEVITDTLDESEITAWAQPPLLLLLTAVAYAAVC